MSLLANIFGPAIGETVKGIADGIGSLAKGIRTAITGTDPDKAAELNSRLAISRLKSAVDYQPFKLKIVEV